MATAKKSVVWNYFKVCENNKYAACNHCKEQVSRGGRSSKTYNTSNLKAHLKKHDELYREFLEKEQETTRQEQPKETGATSSGATKQISIGECIQRTQVWDINDPKSQAVHQKIVEMMALDFQPLSIVDDKGFSSLVKLLEPRYVLPSRRYMSNNVLPQVYNGIEKEVRAELSGITSLSFTTAIWFTGDSNHSMISLTAHWVAERFTLKSAILHVQSFPQSHTGSNICAMFALMFQKWSIDREAVHLVLRDNASNMVKAMKEGGYDSLGCFALTLQLIVHDGVLTQRSVMDTLSACRRIVGHFKHSPLACNKLRVIQKNLNIPEHS